MASTKDELLELTDQLVLLTQSLMREIDESWGDIERQVATTLSKGVSRYSAFLRESVPESDDQFNRLVVYDMRSVANSIYGMTSLLLECLEESEQSQRKIVAVEIHEILAQIMTINSQVTDSLKDTNAV